MQANVIERMGLIAFLVSVTACGQGPELPIEGDRAMTPGTEPSAPTVPPSVGSSTPVEWKTARVAPARPLSGGTLAVSPNGKFAVASDSPGDRAYLVDLSYRAQLGSLAFPSGAPGPAAASDDEAYVLLQGTGEIAAMPFGLPGESTKRAVCATPEGLVVDGELVHVTCRGGQLVTLFRNGLKEKRRVWLEEGLRDVVVRGNRLLVSLLRTAEVLVVDESGSIEQRLDVLEHEFSSSGVLWKMRSLPDGRLALAYERLHNATIEDEEIDAYSLAGDCGSLATPVVSLIELEEDPGSNAGPFRLKAAFHGILASSAGTVDLAVRNGQVFAAIPGNALGAQGRPSVFEVQSGEAGSFCGALSAAHVPAVPIAIAAVSGEAESDSGVLVQTLEPATLAFVDAGGVRAGTEISLHDEPRRDTGMEMFQMTVGSGIACVSCHPLGRTDAHVWHFASVGSRRTQSLEGGTSHRGSFHWDGEFSTFSQLVDDVMTRRMGLLQEVPETHKAALLEFLDSIPSARMDRNIDAAAAARGKVLFEDPVNQCVSCHAGPDFTNNAAYDVGTGGVFVTPSLTDVSARFPIMHDGCAEDLHARFWTCGGGDRHGKTSHLKKGQIDDLVAYLKTL